MTTSTGRVNSADKRIFRGASDVNQLVPFKYTWAWDMYVEANKNHWVPEHAHLALDVKLHGYEQLLSPTAYANVVQYLKIRANAAYETLELLQALYQATTAPECRQYMLRQFHELSVWAELPGNVPQLFPQGWTMPDHHGDYQNVGSTPLTYAVGLLEMLVAVGINNTSLETWLLKEEQLPTELRKIVSWVQRDSILMRRFYTNILNTFLEENPGIHVVVLGNTWQVLDTSVLGQEVAEIVQTSAPTLGNARTLQFARHVKESVQQQLGIATEVTQSPYQVRVDMTKEKLSQPTLGEW